METSHLTEPQIHNKKFTPTAAREFAMYKGQFMPINATDSETLIDMARLARELRELRNNPMIKPLTPDIEYWKNIQELKLALKLNEVIEEINQIKKLIEPDESSL